MLRPTHFRRMLMLLLLILACNIGSTVSVTAQCPMCRISAESNLKNGGTQGRGLNTGILYMLVTPYLLVGTIGYIWWRNRKKAERLEKLEQQGVL